MSHEEGLSFIQKSAIAIPAVAIPGLLFIAQEASAKQETEQPVEVLSNQVGNENTPTTDMLVEPVQTGPVVTVTGGETIEGIATRYGLSPQSLRSETGSDVLTRGQQINLTPQVAGDTRTREREIEEESSDDFEVTVPPIASPSTPTPSPVPEQPPRPTAPTIETATTNNTAPIPTATQQPVVTQTSQVIKMPSISHTPSAVQSVTSLDVINTDTSSNQVNNVQGLQSSPGENSVESVLAPSNSQFARSSTANAIFAPPPEFTTTSTNRNFVAPRAETNPNVISSFTDRAMDLLVIDDLPSSRSNQQSQNTRSTELSQPIEVLTDVPTLISLENGSIRVEVLSSGNPRTSNGSPGNNPNQSSLPEITQLPTLPTTPQVIQPTGPVANPETSPVPPLEINPSTIPEVNNSSADRTSLARATIRDFEAGLKPDITPLLQSVVSDPTLNAQPDGYVFMPQPLVIDGKPEYLFSDGTMRNEQRGNPEIIAVSLAITEYASLLNGPDFITEVGDINSLYHLEHDGKKPAVDLRSRGLQDPNGANNGPLFVEISPNEDLYKQYLMLQYARRLEINGIPAVKYIKGYSDELLARAKQDPEMNRPEARSKNFFLSERDHNEHWHIALNPAAFVQLPLADTESCADACADNSPGITTYQQAIDNAQHISTQGQPEGVQGISYDDALGTASDPPAITASNDNGASRQYLTNIDSVQPPLQSLVNREVLTRAEYWLRQEAIRAGVIPPSLVQVTPVPETPPNINTVSATPESPVDNIYSMPEEAFALLSPEAQTYQVWTREQADFGAKTYGWQSGNPNPDPELAYGPKINPNDTYVMQRFAGHSPLEASLFTGMTGRESDHRPASSGDHIRHDGSYGLLSILTYDDQPNPLRNPSENLNPWKNVVNSREMYLQSGLRPWETNEISNISVDEIYNAIRLGHRNNGQGMGGQFNEHARKSAEAAYNAYLEMEPLVVQAMNATQNRDLIA